MRDIKQRLESELTSTMSRIRQTGGAIVVDELPGAVGDNVPLAGDVDVIGVNEDREMSFAMRSLLVERANRLAEALERLGAGEYGLCEECEEPIASKRLLAMPEVTTCVRCQDQIERAHRFQPVGAGFDREDLDDE